MVTPAKIPATTLGVPVTAELRRWCETRRREGSARFSAETSATLRRSLRLVREHLGLEVAFLARTGGSGSSVQLIDGDPGNTGLQEGSAPPALADFIDRVLRGALPAVDGDARTGDSGLSAGSYVAVAVLGANAHPYGLLAGLGAGPNDTLRARDADTVRLLAEMQSETIAAYESRHAIAEKFLVNAEAMLDAGGLRVALQPILDLGTRQPLAQEALARFPTDAYDTEEWFVEARRAGAGLALELDAISAALAILPSVPAPQRLSINASPDLVTSPSLHQLLADRPAYRLIVEITENNLAENIAALIDRVTQLQQRGTWVAIDDAGTGYSSLSQILQLAPDIIKLDRTLVTEVDTDPMKRALASAIVTFTSQAKVGLVAEGVETEGELRTLTELGVPFGQGYFLARPGPPNPVAN